MGVCEGGGVRVSDGEAVSEMVGVEEGNAELPGPGDGVCVRVADRVDCDFVGLRDGDTDSVGVREGVEYLEGDTLTVAVGDRLGLLLGVGVWEGQSIVHGSKHVG